MSLNNPEASGLTHSLLRWNRAADELSRTPRVQGEPCLPDQGDKGGWSKEILSTFLRRKALRPYKLEVLDWPRRYFRTKTEWLRRAFWGSLSESRHV